MRVLVDTNVLLRCIHQGHPKSAVARNALKTLHRQGFELCVLPQNVREFWNVCTRPINSNGFGLAIPAVERHTRLLERYFKVLPDPERAYEVWRRLVSTHAVSGVKVHDAYLVAGSVGHSIERILTFDASDFARYTVVQAMNPESVTER